MTRFTRNPKTLMWLQACRTIDQLERFRHQPFRPGTQAEQFTSWEPPIDVLESEKELSIVIALPGVAPEEITISLETDLLTVVAEVKHRKHKPLARIRRLEIPRGTFKRCIGLPQGHFRLHRHEMLHGCLHLTLRKL